MSAPAGPGGPRLSGYRIIGAILRALADYAEIAIARGAPARWVVRQQVEMARYVASLAMLADTGYDLGEDPEGFVLPAEPGGPR